MIAVQLSLRTSPATDKYGLKNHLGSHQAEMDINGGALQRVGFDGWGAASNAGFTGFSTQRGSNPVFMVPVKTSIYAVVQ